MEFKTYCLKEFAAMIALAVEHGLQFPLTQQLSLDLDVPVDRRLKFYVANNLITTIDDVWASGTMSSYLTVNNSDGCE